MCVVSMVSDHYRDKFVDPMNPWGIQPFQPMTPGVPMGPGYFSLDLNPPSRAEFDSLKKTVDEMKELLLKAKKYDEDNGEPDCEMDSKVEILRRVAQLVGVSLEDVFGK